MGPTTPGPAALIVDCPSSDYVPALTSHPAFSPWLGGGKSAAVIVHLAPYEVCVALPDVLCLLQLVDNCTRQTWTGVGLLACHASFVHVWQLLAQNSCHSAVGMLMPCSRAHKSALMFWAQPQQPLQPLQHGMGILLPASPACRGAA